MLKLQCDLPVMVLSQPITGSIRERVFPLAVLQKEVCLGSLRMMKGLIADISSSTQGKKPKMRKFDMKMTFLSHFQGFWD